MTDPLDVLNIAAQLDEMVADLQRLHGYSRTLAVKLVLDHFKELLGKSTAENSTFLIGVPDDRP